MSSLSIVRRTSGWAARFLLGATALLLAASCSSDSSTGPGGVPFTEGLTFKLVVNGAWSSKADDSQGRTQGHIRVTVANKSQVWLGSDTMSHIGETPEDERYQATVRIRDLDPGTVTVRVAFQHYDSGTDQEIVTTLLEVDTFEGNPIEIEADKITDIGTIEVTVPQV